MLGKKALLEWMAPRLSILAIAAGILAVHGPLDRLERAAYDTWLTRHATPPWPGDFAVLRIDDAAIRALSSDGQWPLRRAAAADLFDRLREAGAKTIVFDGLLRTKTDPETDARVAKSLSNVLLPIGYLGEPAELSAALKERALLPIAVERPALGPGEGLMGPVDEFAAAAAGLGHVIGDPDPDGLARTHYPFFAVGGKALPSLALRAVTAQAGDDPAKVRWSPASLALPGRTAMPLVDGTLVLEITPAVGPPPGATALELLDPARAEEMRRLYAGKLVLVYMETLRDSEPTALGNETYGGILMAHEIRSIASAHAPRFVPRLFVLAPLLLVLLAAAGTVSRWMPWRIVVIGACAAIAWLSFQRLVFDRTDLFAPLVDPIALAGLSSIALAAHATRTSELERRRLKSLLATAKGAPRPDELPTMASSDSRASTSLLAGVRELQNPVEVGKYTVHRTLGRGGMGAIFLAIDNELQRPVALKILEAASGDAFNRFRREALAVARISHPNVVQIYEVGLHAEVPYLVMEYVAGGTLADLLRDPDVDRLPWERSARIMLGVARGLGAAHARGIVHRDVKPPNVLLEKAGGDVAKVADFGIAKLGGANAEQLTRDGAVLGTLGYLAPEQVAGIAVDARADVYAMAATWFRLLTGTKAFEGTTQELLSAALHRQMPDPRIHVPEIPREVSALLLRMGSRDRLERPKDGDAVAAEIEALLR